MNENMNKDITIGFNEEVISNIRQLLEEGWKKLKSFVKSKAKNKIEISNNNSNLEFYNELKIRFKYIALKLKELKLFEELRYFLSISHFIKYIVYQNSLDSSFGYCDFAIELLEFYLNLFKTNLEFYASPQNSDEFAEIQNDFKRKHFDYKREFYWNIYQADEDFDEDRMSDVAKSLRG